MYSYRSVSVQGDTEIGKVAVQGRDGTNMVKNHPDAADAYSWSLILERGEHRVVSMSRKHVRLTKE